MKDFNIAALLLKNYDTDKWTRLPGKTKRMLVNEFLEFRNRLLIVADMTNHQKIFKEEVERIEHKIIAKNDDEDDRELKRLMVERKTEAEIIAEFNNRA